MAKLSGVKTLDMINGEITKVEYDGAVYESAGKKDGKAGDLGLRIAANASHAKIGEFYKVVDKVGAIGFKDDEGDTPKIWEHQENFAYFRKVAEPLKAGDYAKVVQSTYHNDVKIGSIVELISCADSDGDYQIELLDKTDYDYAKATSLQKLTDEEVTAAKKEIEAKESQRELEEKWLKIGRKVDEYKKGDIVRVLEDDANGSNHKAGDIGEITTDEDEFTDRAFRVDTPRIDYVNWVRPKDVKLITPVEARFDR
jgi:hypothetical protein